MGKHECCRNINILLRFICFLSLNEKSSNISFRNLHYSFTGKISSYCKNLTDRGDKKFDVIKNPTDRGDKKFEKMSPPLCEITGPFLK